MSVRLVSPAIIEIIMGDGSGRPLSMVGSPLSAWDFTIMLTKNGHMVNSGLYRLSNSGITKIKKKSKKFKKKYTNYHSAMSEDNFKRHTIDLARASYLSLDQAAAFGDSLGFTLDNQLSQVDTLVYTDKRTGQPTIVHRDSTSPRDFLVDDALIAFGSGRETQRQRRAREITASAEAKYNKPSNSTGHSLGGRLAERSGSGGSIVTFNKAAGLGDIPNFNFTGRSQPQIQNGSRQTDASANAFILVVYINPHALKKGQKESYLSERESPKTKVASKRPSGYWNSTHPGYSYIAHPARRGLRDIAHYQKKEFWRWVLEVLFLVDYDCGCMELKTPNQMNHRLRKTGEVTITDKCMHCYRTQARVRSIRHRITHDETIMLNEALDLLDAAYE
ncbi:hypothetical protein T492DRAFT_850161 [Pavlovales sp. CCMP2436]|nr:hypothetical protein T492DRAFT_850161 [Pavlovales sp. CCMP2436]